MLRWLAMERDLGLLLSPLPWTALPVVLPCVQQPVPAIKLRSFVRGDPWNVSLALVNAENVLVKVQSVFPISKRALEDRCFPATRCNACHVTLRFLSEMQCKFLAWDSNLSQGRVRTHKCDQCNKKYVGCWSYGDAPECTLRLESDPALQTVMPVMPFPRTNAVGVVHIRFVEMYSLMLAHSRVRARSYSTCCPSFFNFSHVEHLHDTILHTWFVFRSIQLCSRVSLTTMHSVLHRVFQMLYSPQHSCVKWKDMHTVSCGWEIEPCYQGL